MVTVIINHSYTCVRAVFSAATIRGQHIFSSRASDCVATIRGWRLFKEIWYVQHIYKEQTLFGHNSRTYWPKYLKLVTVKHLSTSTGLICAS